MNLEELMWAQKYRPQKIDDIILPRKVKEHIKKCISENAIPNLLFDGGAGIGKTTTAQAIAKELGHEILILNGSGNGRGIDVVRNEIISFCSTMSFDGNRKIVLIDEADNLTNDSQLALRHTIEEFSSNVSFIFTTNYKDLIHHAVLDRFMVVPFDVSKEEQKELKIEFFKRCVNILKENDVVVGKEQMKVLSSLIEKNFPHFRKTLNTLQSLVQRDELNASSLSIIDGEKFITLAEHLKTGSWNKMRTWVAENPYVTPEELVGYFYDNGSNLFGDKNMPVLILHLDDYQKIIHTVRNPTVSTTALMTKIIQSLVKV